LLSLYQLAKQCFLPKRLFLLFFKSRITGGTLKTARLKEDYSMSLTDIDLKG
jgi:hypothetical protein